MNIDEINEVLDGIREALLKYQDGHHCRRCRKEMPSMVTGICLGAGVFNEAEPKKTWAVNWRAAQDGWGFVEIDMKRFWICPGCVSELLPL